MAVSVGYSGYECPYDNDIAADEMLGEMVVATLFDGQPITGVLVDFDSKHGLQQWLVQPAPDSEPETLALWDCDPGLFWVSEDRIRGDWLS